MRATRYKETYIILARPLFFSLLDPIDIAPVSKGYLRG